MRHQCTILSFVMCGWSSKCLFQITHRKLNFTDRWMLECLSGFPSQTTWMLLQMSRNCGKAATLVWHSILLLLANISQADFMRWTYINHSLHQSIGKNNSKIQSTAEKTHTLAKKKKTPTKQPETFTLQAWRVMSKASLYCCFWHCHFRCWETQCLQFVTSDLWALAFPQVVMMQTRLWKVIKLLEQEHNKTQNSHLTSNKCLKIWPL